jgi:hypothetical protein
MDTNEQTCEATQATSEAVAKRVYRTPEVVELGDVRELTRQGGSTKRDGKNSYRHG